MLATAVVGVVIQVEVSSAGLIKRSAVLSGDRPGGGILVHGPQVAPTCPSTVFSRNSDRLVVAPVSGLIENGVLPTISAAWIFHPVWNGRMHNRPSGRHSPPNAGQCGRPPGQGSRNRPGSGWCFIQLIPLPGHPAKRGRQGTQALANTAQRAGINRGFDTPQVVIARLTGDLTAKLGGPG